MCVCVCVCALYSPTTHYLSYNKMYFQGKAGHGESFVFSKNTLFQSYGFFSPNFKDF